MKIVEPKKPYVVFADIGMGNVFYYEPEGSYGFYYMRCEEICTDEGDVLANAIDMKTGELAAFADYDEVHPVTCYLAVE